MLVYLLAFGTFVVGIIIALFSAMISDSKKVSQAFLGFVLGFGGTAVIGYSAVMLLFPEPWGSLEPRLLLATIAVVAVQWALAKAAHRFLKKFDSGLWVGSW